MTPRGPLLVDQLRFMAAEHGNTVAYENLADDSTITFEDWERQSNRVARWLGKQGVRHGDRVALYLESVHCLEWIVAYAGIHKAGAVMVPVNTRLSINEVITILNHAEVAATISGGELLSNLNALRDGTHLGRALGVAALGVAALGVAALGVAAQRDRPDDTDLGEVDLTDVDSWSALEAFDPEAIQVPVDLDDMADIMYTSGTTGLPKGVLVRHRNVAMIPNCAPRWSGAGWLHGAPLFTFAGLSFIYNPMKMGLRGLYLPKFDATRWFDLVAGRQPLMAFLVPAMAELLAAHPQFGDADLSSLAAVSIGSAPLAPTTLATLQAKMPGASVTNSYGLTEAGPAYIVMPKDQATIRIGSVGKPMSPMEVKVVDPDSDVQLAANAVGELLVRLPGARREYYNDDIATAAAWTEDGWLRTGDLASLDDDGFVYINGRIKDMIIRGGNNIYATDIEAVVLQYPQVREVAVVGVPHPVLGEDVGAFIVLRPGSAFDRADFDAHCGALLADYKRPRTVHIVAELPRNATGKIMKHKLRESLGAEPRTTE